MQAPQQQPQPPLAQPPKPGARKPVPLPPIPPEFKAEAVTSLDAAKLMAILQDPGATLFQKAKACQRLAVLGSKEAVPALSALLTDPQLAHYARYGLEPIPDPSADQALREALPKLKGALLVGVINSIGHRRDPKAADALSKLLYSTDVEVARAAAFALGRISGPQAAKTLQAALSRTKGSVRSAVAAAGLVCAEALVSSGDRKAGLALYDALSRPGVPRAVRLAALHSLFSTEISLSRPR